MNFLRVLSININSVLPTSNFFVKHRSHLCQEQFGWSPKQLYNQSNRFFVLPSKCFWKFSVLFFAVNVNNAV